MSTRRWLTGLVLSAACFALAFAVAEALFEQHLAITFLEDRYEFLVPAALGLIAFVPLLPWAAIGSNADLPRVQRSVALLLRTLLLLVLAVALARPTRTYDATRISTVFLLDVSDSVTDADLTASRKLLGEAWRARGMNDVRLVTFAGRPRAVALPDDATDVALGAAVVRHAARPEDTTPGARTDLAAALRLAYGLSPPGHIRRAVLLTDGLETHGDLLEEATRAKRIGVSVFFRLFDRGRPPEVAVSELLLPEKLSVGESFELRAHIFASQPTRGRLRLYQDQVLNNLDSIRDVELTTGDNEVRFRSVVRTAGQVSYRLDVHPSGSDHFIENNSATAMAIVPGRPSVLVIESDPAHGQALAQALNTDDFEVEVRAALGLPRSLAELGRYDFLILSDVPAEQVSSGQMDAIGRYVRDLGGGFMMVGGDQSFGLGGYQGTPIEALLPVTMDSERRSDEHSLALALVIDCSGSMAGQKIELAKDAAKAAAAVLGPGDSLAVIGFSGEAERSVRMQSAKNRSSIERSIGRLAAQGGTSIFPALDMAFQDLSAATARIKHVILLTDGQTQENGIPDLVQAMRADGITVSTVGLGNDVNRSLLQQAASLGAGRAYFPSDPSNVPRIFIRETTTVGQNSAVEESVRMLPLEPADFLNGIDLSSAPFLRGYVATRAKRKPAQVVLQSELGEPLLARWRAGLGWSLAWTSDLKPRWATDLLRWRAFPTFIGQLVREHMRAQRHDDLPMHAELRNDQLHVWVDAIGPDDRFQNDLESTVILEGPVLPASTPPRQERSLSQRAPGRYEANLALSGYGSFALHAVHRRAGRVVAQSHAQVSRAYPTEYAVRPPNRSLLQRAAALTGGHAVTSAQQLFDPSGQRIEAHEEVWSRLVWFALGLFLVDLALRRIRLFKRRPPP